MSARDEEMNERRKHIGSTNTTTYFREAEIALGLENQGRFGATAQVIGSNPNAGSQYPRLPGNNPYAFDPVPPEEALGYSVEDQLVCGTPAEVQQSIDALSIEASSTVVGSAEASFAASSSLSGDASDGVDELESAEGVSSSLPNPQQSRPSTPTNQPPTLTIKRRKGL